MEEIGGKEVDGLQVGYPEGDDFRGLFGHS